MNGKSMTVTCRQNLACNYGDYAYPRRPHLQAPFRALSLTEQEIAYNKATSAARVRAEWMFEDIINFFSF